MSVPLCSYMEPGIIILRRRGCSHLCLTCRPEPKLRNGPNVEQLRFHNFTISRYEKIKGDLSNIRAGLANLLNFAFFPLAPPLSSRPPIRNWRVFQFPGFVERNFPQSWCSFPCFTCPIFLQVWHILIFFSLDKDRFGSFEVMTLSSSEGNKSLRENWAHFFA